MSNFSLRRLCQIFRFTRKALRFCRALFSFVYNHLRFALFRLRYPPVFFLNFRALLREKFLN